MDTSLLIDSTLSSCCCCFDCFSYLICMHTYLVQLSMEQTTIDMSMVPTDSSFGTLLLELVQEGSIDENRVDESCRRVLELKETLGLLDQDYDIGLADPNIVSVGQDSDWNKSLNAARESVTLLKNEDNTLPISKSAGVQIYLTGITSILSSI